MLLLLPSPHLCSLKPLSEDPTSCRHKHQLPPSSYSPSVHLLKPLSFPVIWNVSMKMKGFRRKAICFNYNCKWRWGELVILCFFWWLYHVACRILVLQGSNLFPLHWSRVLTTGPLGKSQGDLVLSVFLLHYTEYTQLDYSICVEQAS